MAHRFEWLAPVLVVDAVFVLFLVAQAAVIFGGHDYLERTTGLTYAEYVHQGFGQLTVATALTLLVVWAASRKAPRATPSDRAWLRGSLGLLGAATMVVVASALYRMSVYQDAYGFTRLRLLVDVFEGWLGLLVLATMAGGVALRAAVAAAVRAAHRRRRRCSAWPRSTPTRGSRARTSTGTTTPARSTGPTWPASPTTRSPCCATCPPTSSRARSTSAAAHDDDWLEWNLGRALASDFVEEHEDGWVHRTDCPGQTYE